MPSLAALSASEEEYQTLEATLLNTSGDVPLAKRFRALFTLRNLKTRRAIDIIGQGASGLLLYFDAPAADCWTPISSLPAVTMHDLI